MNNLFWLQGSAVSDTTDVGNMLIEGVGETKISIIDMIINGGWYIMVPLGLLSIIAVYIFIERFVAITKASKIEKDFMNRIKDYIFDGKMETALDLCKQNDKPLSRMIGKGISRIGKPTSEISASIENVGKLEIYKMERGLNTLATVAGAAPMIGFLGTVIGMIVTFHQMSISATGVEIKELSGGIMQAMVTTVAGLIIGIIAYMAYNTLVSKVDKVVHELEGASEDFIDLLEEPA